MHRAMHGFQQADPVLGSHPHVVLCGHGGAQHAGVVRFQCRRVLAFWDRVGADDLFFSARTLLGYRLFVFFRAPISIRP